MISVSVGHDEIVKVPWGRIEIPGIDGYLSPGVDRKDGRAIFALCGVVKNKCKKQVDEIAALTREFLKRESIYKGKAIRVTFESEDETGFDPYKCPRFIDVGRVKEEELIFSNDVNQLIDVALFTPIVATEACRKHKIPLKRGILLEGPYGTGKTLTAYVAAAKCVRNGWTFIYVDRVKDIATALHFAKQYSPAVVFAEDIDRVTSGKRDEHMDEIFNTIDGVELKAAEVLVVLTTNHVEKISQAMLRPGRLDAIVSVKPPDAEAVQRLIRLYGRNLIEANADLTQVGDILKGQIPSVVREVVERSKLAAISRIVSEGRNADTFTLLPADLCIAAQGIQRHIELLKPKEPDVRSDVEKAAAVIADSMRPVAHANGNGKSDASASHTASHAG